MNPKLRIVYMTIFLMIIFSPIINTSKTQAFTPSPNYVEYGTEMYDGSSSYTSDKCIVMDTKYGVLPNGNCVFAYIPYTDTSFVYIKVIDSSGNELRETIHSTSNYYFRDVSVYVIDDDNVLIFCTQQYLSTTQYSRSAVILYNPTTGSHTQYSSGGFNMGSSGMTIRYCWISNVIKYSNTYYAISNFMTYDAGNGWKCYSTLISYASTTCSYSSLYSTNYDPTGYILRPFWVQPSTSSSTVYALYCYKGHDITGLYSIDLTSPSLTFVCDMSTSYNQALTYATEYSHRKIAFDIETNGTDVYVYNVDARSQAGSGGGYHIQSSIDVIKFNATITSATILEQNYDYYYEGTEVPGTNYPFVSGFMSNVTSYTLYYPYGGLEPDMLKIRIVIDDMFTDVTITPDDAQFPITDTMPVTQNYQLTCYYGWDFVSVYAVTYHYDTDVRIYYGLSPLGGSYTLTVTYTPYDSYMVVDSVYTFTVNMKFNGINYVNGIMSVHIDNVTLGWKVTDKYGNVYIPLKFSSSGIHTLKIYSYPTVSDPIPCETFEQDYTVIDSIASEEEQVTTALFAGATLLILNVLPVAVCTMPFAFMGYKMAKAIGFFAGLSLGVFIAVKATLLPEYALYVMLLLTGVIVVMSLRQSSGG